MNDIKQVVCRTIDEMKPKLMAIYEDIFQNPELGFQETRTAGVVRDALTELGADRLKTVGVTGVKGWIDGRSSDMSVAVIGELDAVACPQHPNADRRTGVAHVCGHAAQLATLVGCARAVGRTCLPDGCSRGRVCTNRVPQRNG